MKHRSPKVMNSQAQTFVLTNLWTYAKHGHAKSELYQVQDLLNSLRYESHMIGLSYEFDSSRIISLGRLAHKFKLDHKRAFKPWVDRKLIQDLESSLLKVSNSSTKTVEKIVFTSAKFNHVSELGKLWEGNNNLSLRLIESSRQSEKWDNILKLIQKANFRTTLAIEHKKSALEGQSFFSRTMHVPAAQSLKLESDQVNSSRNRVGIFFPVGRPLDLNFGVALIHAVKHLNPIVKLPSYLNSRRFISMYPEVEFIERDVSDERLGGILSTIRVAILAHDNYVNRSSAYASYFVSNGVPTLTQKSNDFESEFGDDYLFSLPQDLKQISGLIRDLENGFGTISPSPFSRYAKLQWTEFLLDGLKKD
jgi:hypothetical protein